VISLIGSRELQEREVEEARVQPILESLLHAGWSGGRLKTALQPGEEAGSFKLRAIGRKVSSCVEPWDGDFESLELKQFSYNVAGSSSHIQLQASSSSFVQLFAYNLYIQKGLSPKTTALYMATPQRRDEGEI
jgi:hypothetical protein